jgi:hypothetical protein
MEPFLLDQVFEEAVVFDFRELDSRRLVRPVTFNGAVEKLGTFRLGVRGQFQVIVHVRQPFSFYSVLRTHALVVFVCELSIHLPAHHRLRASEPAIVKVELHDYLMSTWPWTNGLLAIFQTRSSSCQIFLVDIRVVFVSLQTRTMDSLPLFNSILYVWILYFCSPLLIALYPSRNKHFHFRRDRLICSRR